MFTRYDGLLTSLLLVAIFATAIPAWLSVRRSEFDNRAAEQLVLIRDALYSKHRQSKTPLFLHRFNIDRPSDLKSVLPGISLADGIQVHALMHISRGRSTLTMISLSHERGAFLHRWIDAYSVRRLQKIVIDR